MRRGAGARQVSPAWSQKLDMHPRDQTAAGKLDSCTSSPACSSPAPTTARLRARTPGPGPASAARSASRASASLQEGGGALVVGPLGRPRRAPGARSPAPAARAGRRTRRRGSPGRAPAAGPTTHASAPVWPSRWATMPASAPSSERRMSYRSLMASRRATRRRGRAQARRPPPPRPRPGPRARGARRRSRFARRRAGSADCGLGRERLVAPGPVPAAPLDAADRQLEPLARAARAPTRRRCGSAARPSTSSPS